VSLPLSAAGRRSTFFEQESLDHLVTMMVELSAELWVVRERLYAAEAMLDAQTPGFRQQVERWQPNEAQAAELVAMRQTMLASLYRTLEIERPGPSDEAIVAAAA
jgi:hypothetical protein